MDALQQIADNMQQAEPNLILTHNYYLMSDGRACAIGHSLYCFFNSLEEGQDIVTDACDKVTMKDLFFEKYPDLVGIQLTMPKDSCCSEMKLDVFSAIEMLFEGDDWTLNQIESWLREYSDETQ